MRLAILLAFAIALEWKPVWGMPDAELLFASGFEYGTVLEAIPATAIGDSFQHFAGVDGATGFAWPLALWGASPVTSGVHSIVGRGNRVEAFASNYIETVNGPRNLFTRALRMQIFSAAPGFCCVQSMFQVSAPQQPVSELYARLWMKLNPEIEGQIAATGGEFWRTLWVLKTRTDYRITTFVVRGPGGAPAWRMIVDNNPNGSRPHCPENACWTVDIPTVPVPLGRWFVTETYLRRSATNDGRIFWAVDGRVLVDRYGPSYGAYRENINFLAFSALYGHHRNMAPAYQWVDDIEVWDGPPCDLPCGPVPLRIERIGARIRNPVGRQNRLAPR